MIRLMKKQSLFLTFMLSLGMAGFACAQAPSAVPTLMNYQAYVSGPGGAVIGATPVNRLVHFKFYTTPTPNGQTILYSESQTVTINNGNFSVLLGQGDQIGSEPNDFNNAFTNQQVFLGITVDVGGDGFSNDTEISPRQQIVSTAFAMRSKVAESVTIGAITNTMLASGSVDADKLGPGAVTLDKVALGAIKGGNDGDPVTANQGTILDASITSFDLASNSVTNAKMADNAVGNAELADNAVTSGKIAAGAVGVTDLAANVGVFTKSGGTLSYSGGKIGIGTTNPNNNQVAITDSIGQNTATPGSAVMHEGQLDIRAGTTNRSMGIGVTDFGIGFIQVKQQNVAGESIASGGGYQPLLLNPFAGRVGIGTNNPTQAKLVVIGDVNFTHYASRLGLAESSSVRTDTTPISIHASEGVAARRFLSFSDERIKNVVGRSDGSRDLADLLEIEVTDYTYIDKLLSGAARQKKVIAQQVEKVFPEAVSQGTDVIPDIYQKADIEGDWVRLATPLKKGERVRLIAEKEEGIYEVLEVAEDRFRTAFKPAGDQVFVYGREVNDFRSVDYEAIAMLNVSATQELARKLEARETEVADLKKRLSLLEAKDKARDAKLAVIERLLSADSPALHAVSLKQSGGTE